MKIATAIDTTTITIITINMILNFDWNIFPNEISRPPVPLTLFEVSTTFLAASSKP
jgi:hypothetical protein